MDHEEMHAVSCIGLISRFSFYMLNLVCCRSNCLSFNMHDVIASIYVVDKLPSSDHLPLVLTFSMKVVDSAHVTSAHVNKGNEACQTTDWYNATANYKHAYAAESRMILGDVCIPDALLCKHVNCSNPDHVAAIDDFYHSINRSLIASSADTIRSRHYARRKRHKQTRTRGSKK